MSQDKELWGCDDCGDFEFSAGLPKGWTWDGPGMGAALCLKCSRDRDRYQHDLESLGTIGPQDQTP